MDFLEFCFPHRCTAFCVVCALAAFSLLAHFSASENFKMLSMSTHPLHMAISDGIFHTFMNFPQQRLFTESVTRLTRNAIYHSS